MDKHLFVRSGKRMGNKKNPLRDFLSAPAEDVYRKSLFELVLLFCNTII